MLEYACLEMCCDTQLFKAVWSFFLRRWAVLRGSFVSLVGLVTLVTLGPVGQLGPGLPLQEVVYIWRLQGASFYFLGGACGVQGLSPPTADLALAVWLPDNMLLSRCFSAPGQPSLLVLVSASLGWS